MFVLMSTLPETKQQLSLSVATPQLYPNCCIQPNKHPFLPLQYNFRYHISGTLQCVTETALTSSFKTHDETTRKEADFKYGRCFNISEFYNRSSVYPVKYYS
jgi:hypothetical protein